MKFIFCSLFFLTTLSLTAHPFPSSLTFGGGYSYLKEGCESGNLGEFITSYAHQPTWQYYAGATFNLKKGSIQSSERNKQILDIGAQGRLGYTFGAKDQSWIFSLFSGLGYRYINQKESWFQIPFSSSLNDFYIPVGFITEGKLSSRICLGISSQWRPQVYTTMSFSSRERMLWITQNKLGSFLIEVPLTIQLHSSQPIYLLCTPFLDFWQKGRTIVATRFGPPFPKQDFLFIGINVSCRYPF